MIAITLGAVLAAGPALESRLFIGTGAKTKAEAQTLSDKLTLPKSLVLASGFPKLVESKSIAGLKPGFFVVLLGACADVSAAERSHNNGFTALLQDALKGAYSKPVGKQENTCPLWLEETETALEQTLVDAVKKQPNDVKALSALALAQRATGAVFGPAILTRRAIALGAADKATLELSKTVEFILEDLPDAFPK